MRLALSNRDVEDLADEVFLAAALSCGCDGVELYELGLIRESVGRHFEVLGSEAAKMGLEVAALCTSAHLADPLLVEHEIASVCDVIRAAPRARAKLVEVIVGRPPSLHARPENWAACVSALQRCVWVADRRQVPLAVKIHFSTLADTLAASVRLLDQVDRPQLGVAVDARHLWLSSDDPGSAVSIHSGRVKFTHVQETGPCGAPFGYVGLAEGHSGVEQFVASLCHQGYAGYLCLSLEGVQGKQFAEAAKRDAELLKDLMLHAAQMAAA
jgi:sugar phosphate isomerase/epimerase